MFLDTHAFVETNFTKNHVIFPQGQTSGTSEAL